MSIDAFYSQPVHGWAYGTYGDWSYDYEIAPSSVYGSAQLASYSSDNGGADLGFSQYTVRDPDTGVDSTVTLGGTQSPDLVGLVPAFYADNVDSLTFWFYVEDGNGNGTIAMALFNVFFWG